MTTGSWASAVLGGAFLLAAPVWVSAAVVGGGPANARWERIGHAAMSAAMGAMLLTPHM